MVSRTGISIAPPDLCSWARRGAIIVPHTIFGPSVWKRTDFRHESEWTRVFPTNELALNATMGCVRRDLLAGRGFCVLRGLEVDRHDFDALRLAFWRLAAHLGEIIPQNADGDLLRCVTDLGDEVTGSQDAPRALGHRGRARMLPHSDSSDIVALLCARQARIGGGNSVSSSMAIHNEILRTHPEYLNPLYEGFYFDLTGKTKTDDGRTDHRIPVFSCDKTGLSCMFNKSRIETGMRRAGIPLNDFQQAAIDYLNSLAMHEEFAIPLRLIPGDILLLNNHSTLHAREQYEDWPEPDRKRLMLRLWVNLNSERKEAQALK